MVVFFLLYLVRDIKPPNNQSCFPQFFPRMSSWKENEFFIGPKLRKKTCLGPQKCLFSLSTTQAEKNSWKKLGKTRLVVWWFDVTNKIVTGKWIFLKLDMQLFVDFCVFSRFWLNLLDLNLKFFCFDVQNNVKLWFEMNVPL